MSFFIWTMVVGVMGWSASLAMKSDASPHHVWHVSIGVSGALLGGLLMKTPVTWGANGRPDDTSILSLLVSFFIALALSMIANLWDRVSTQDDVEMDF